MIAIEAREHTNSVPMGPPAKEEIQSKDLHVFDTSLYRNLFNQAVQAGLSQEQARSVVTFAATYDSLGAITENISGEKDGSGNYIFDVETRIRMQLTPPKHLYLQVEDENIHEPMMVAPEHKRGSFKKDVLSLISNWRRGMDKVGMAGVRARFLDKSEDSLKVGETIIWGSPKAEQWEGENVMKYNGKYGFLYVGRVISINGTKVLEVYDFKNDLDAAAYYSFFQSIEGEISTNPSYLDRPFVDKVKASYVRTNQLLNADAVWRKLGEIQQQVTGKKEIFNLPADIIISLQDRELYKRIHSEVAVPIGTWIANEIFNGVSTDEIQSQIRQKFIDATLGLINKIKTERAWLMQLAREQSRINVGYMQAAESQRYTNQIDPAILLRYSGSGGLGCGSWGSGNSAGGFGSSISSVFGLSSAFGSSENRSGVCRECGKSSADDHYHCDNCGKWYASERNSVSRTPQCSCGRKFGC